MKHFLLYCLIYSSLINAAFAQEKWGSYDTTIAGTQFTLLEACGDTIVDGVNYEKLYSSSFGFNTPIGGRRVQGDSVFVKYFYNNAQESLLYDYSMLVGDSIEGVWGKFMVTEIQTELVFGSTRKKFLLTHSEYDYEDIWIEDVGSIVSGYLHAGIPQNIIDAGSSYSCYYYDDIDDWYYAGMQSIDCLADQFESACISTNTDETKAEFEFEVFPNPATDHFILRMDMNEKSTGLRVFDIAGQIILEKRLYSEESRINTNSFPEGLYILEIRQGLTVEYVKIAIN